ncbi:MAG: UDP-N-acetylmuramoyl-L-alanyl-D-glutamate--2,6-diaminopimelate ligase [Deltaproteobacteria bacterium]|jgi:UDP-N-acetylmuramoyl-L-alanyl-D-glutamate--2,6-diaminopimelate ligase|nr:UDP-N-acetylmuramoyl-L-alanyl-D-glutamate--2,6-diaminopimelate ligase [Deltaproteobacteria bacterium]
MKLSELIKNIDLVELRGEIDPEVCDLVYSSKDASSGKCFFAIKGLSSDGHDFVGDAISNGAAVVVTEKAISNVGECVNVIVRDTRVAMAEMASRFFGEPTKSMKLIGITGTNGKTTTTYILEGIFCEAGFNPGIIGTINYRYNGKIIKAPRTTPESIDLQRLLAEMRDSGVDLCIMEVSSHALAQKRVFGCHFDVAVFTNLTPEHLDYHRDMEEYFEAKAILFNSLLEVSCKDRAFSVINGDDPYGRRLSANSKRPCMSYGLKNESTITAEGLEFNSNGLKLRVKTPDEVFECRSKLCGRFNALNILSAITAACGMGLNSGVISDAIEKLEVVPGRFESIDNDRGILALVDYAHTPDALENLLKNARELCDGNGGKLITVFGCGGDRDRAKRPLMGRAVGSLSDISFVTSDNPRTEKPESIIDEIIPGMDEVAKPLRDGMGYEVVVDRRAAIQRAVDIADQGDVVVVAGKGHEDYQILGSDRIHFDDREILKGFLKE